MSNFLHLVNGIDYKNADGTYNMVIEIPAGTNQKWQTDAESGKLYHEHVDGSPRIIDFVSYPFNYGFIPQTYLNKAKGGDGDPIDVVLISPVIERGIVQPLKIIGALKFVERGEDDTKLVGILPQGPFQGVSDLSELLMHYPGALEIIRFWFEGYKGPGSLFFQGYADKNEAQEMIHFAYQEWQAEIPSNMLEINFQSAMVKV